MSDNFTNEFFGIGIQNGKTPQNLGVLWRSAQNLGASFIFTIGNRYAKQACDTHDAVKAMPYFHYDTFDDFFKNLPKGVIFKPKLYRCPKSLPITLRLFCLKMVILPPFTQALSVR